MQFHGITLDGVHLANRIDLESDDGESGTFRFGRQLALVLENQYHSLPQQSRSVQGQAWKIASWELLPGLFRG